jgi:2-amino-4-hydroxy-6-hydroxymethyldihydropteridine diphosphokinase
METISRKTLIALGSNEESVWGDATLTVQKAMQRVSELAISAPSCSLLYNTPAFPARSGPAFVNAVMALDTDLSPQDLLAALHLIEAAAGRTRTTRWGQRTLDLDLIAMGERVLPDLPTFEHWRNLPQDAQTQQAPQTLILPHPRLQDRGFVLVPMMDVAPDWVHPVLGQTVRELCMALPAADRASVVPLTP